MDFDVNGGGNGFSIGNPQIVTTTLVRIGDKRQVVFKPLKAGETNVTVRDADGTIRLIFMLRITGSSLLRVAGEVRSLLRDIEGLDIRIVGPKVVIEGEVVVPNDYGRLLAVIQDKSYADFILNLANLSPMTMQIMAKKIQTDIVSFAPNVTTRVVNGMIFLEGSVDNKDQSDRAMKVADLYLPDLKPGSLLEKDPSVQRHPPRQLINNFILINPPAPKKQDKLVRITVHFVELAKSYAKTFSFMWQPAYTEYASLSLGANAGMMGGGMMGGGMMGGGGGMMGGGGGMGGGQMGNGMMGGGMMGGQGFSFGATISSLIPKLDSMQNAGYGRIIKSGTVIVRSREAAKLVEQTEFPVVSVGANGQASASSKPVGLSVAVTPTIIGQSDDIELQLELDESTVRGRAPAPGGMPTTDVQKIKTNIYIKSKESAAVAGVTDSAITTDFNKDPPYAGSYDPGQGTSALFTLMRSKAYTKQKSQFVVFVTPEILESASEGTEDLKRNFRVKVK